MTTDLNLDLLTRPGRLGLELGVDLGGLAALERSPLWSAVPTLARTARERLAPTARVPSPSGASSSEPPSSAPSFTPSSVATPASAASRPRPTRPRRGLVLLLIVVAMVSLAVGSASSSPPVPAAAVSAAPMSLPPALVSSPVSSSSTPAGSATGETTPEVRSDAAPALVSGPRVVPGLPAAPCLLGDVAACVGDAVDAVLRRAVTDVLNPALAMLSGTLLSTPRLDQVPRVGELWNTSWQLVVAVYGLLVLVAGILLMSQGVRAQYEAREIAPRLVAGFLAGALSLPIAGIAIDLANALSTGVMGPGLDPEQAAPALGRLLLAAPGTGAGAASVLLAVVVVVLLIAVLLVYIARVAAMTILLIAAPLALMFHALPQTDGIARAWWRALAGLLAIQVLQSLTLVTALRVFLTPDGVAAIIIPAQPSVAGLVDTLLLLVLLWALWRIPFWVMASVRGPRGGGRSVVGTVVRTVIAAKTFGALGLGGGAAAGRAGAGGLRGAAGRAAASVITHRTRRPGAGGGPGRGPGGGPGRGPGARGPRPDSTSAGAGAGKGSGEGAGRGGEPGPYRRLRAGRDGQLRLPLEGLVPQPRPRTSPRSTPGAAGKGRAGSAGPRAATPGTRRSLAASGRQFALFPPRGLAAPVAPDPYRGNRPMRGGPHAGQYPLPLGPLPRTRPGPPSRPGSRPVPPPPPPQAQPPRAAQPPRPAQPPRQPAQPARQPAGGEQTALPIDPPVVDPYASNRPLRGGQYPLPLEGLTRHPRPPQQAGLSSPAGRPRGSQPESGRSFGGSGDGTPPRARSGQRPGRQLGLPLDPRPTSTRPTRTPRS